MRYTLDVNDEGYVMGVSSCDSGELTAEQLSEIQAFLQNKPIAGAGFDYRLKADTMLWEIYEIPPTPAVYTQAVLEQMTNAELEQILYSYGRTANMTKANLASLILQLQGGDYQ